MLHPLTPFRNNARSRVYSAIFRVTVSSRLLSRLKAPAESATRREEDSVQVFLRLLLPLLPEVRTAQTKQMLSVFLFFFGSSRIAHIECNIPGIAVRTSTAEEAFCDDKGYVLRFFVMWGNTYYTTDGTAQHRLFFSTM